MFGYDYFPNYKLSCHIASAETKRDWLIHGHVALDKCNVSLEAARFTVRSTPDFENTNEWNKTRSHECSELFWLNQL